MFKIIRKTIGNEPRAISYLGQLVMAAFALILTAGVLGFGGSVGAATIAGVSQSNISHGDFVTISGSGFGIHPDYSPAHDYLPRLYDNFESGIINTDDGCWDAISPYGAIVNSNNNRPNSNFCVAQVRGSEKHSSLGHKGDTSQDVLYMSAWRNYDPFTTVEHGSKIWRVWHEFGQTPDWVMSISAGAGQFVGNFGWLIEGFFNEPGCDDTGSFGIDFANNWHFYEIILDRGVNSEVSIYMDGNLMSNAIPSTWGVWTPNVILFESYSHESDDPNTYTDDTYISHTRARIMISDSSNFSETSHREIQIPTAWVDSSITFTANQGSFQDGDSAYLFVVDENGNTSNGYPITFGTTLFGDLTGDSLINIQDIQACVNHILGTQDWGDAADVNEDAAVNVLDVQAIVNIVLGV